MTLLREIVIENYPDKLLIAKKRRAKYYTRYTTKALPKKYQNSDWEYNVKDILVNVIKINPKVHK